MTTLWERMLGIYPEPQTPEQKAKQKADMDLYYAQIAKIHAEIFEEAHAEFVEAVARLLIAVPWLTLPLDLPGDLGQRIEARVKELIG